MAANRLTFKLQVAGSLRGKPRAQEGEKKHDYRDHQQLHGDEVLPGPRCIRGMRVNQRQNRVSQAGKMIVEQAR